MSEAQQNTPASPAAANGTGVVASLEARAADAFGPSDPAGEEGSPPVTSTNDTASPAGSEGPDAERAKRQAERRAKWQELQQRERASVDAKAAQKEAETLRRQLAEAQAAQARLVDPTSLDPIKIIELGQRAGHSPKAIADALASAMGSPELAAAYAAQTAVSPKIADLEKRIAEQDAQLAKFIEAQQQTAQQAHVAQAQQQFLGYAAQNAATSPLAARFLEQAGPEEFLILTAGAASALPDDAGADAILDEIEDRLASLQRIYQPAQAGQRTQATPPRTNAAAQAPTHVTNQLASQRSSVVDEDAAWATMSLDERAARLFDS